MTDIIDQYLGVKSGIQDTIKTLRANISFAGIDQEIKTITVTSTIPGEGKTTVSLFLAIEMAESGKRTVIVEGDCRRPSVGNMLKSRPMYGMSNVLLGSAQLDEAIWKTKLPNLYFLDSGSRISNPVELISSKKYSALIAQLKEQFDVVLFDTPPLGSFIESAVLAAQCDGTLLVVRRGGANREKIAECVEQLRKANAKILGIVLNMVEKSEVDYYDYYHYRESNAHSDGHKTQRKRDRKQVSAYRVKR